ncbi:DMT family transporter [Phaeovulum veldkampii]|uniref:DMT family transporter n=1 Tax=Phaeovulum veldkampii TaxID=33049 RepID=UPI0010DB7A26|nr:DMT family transporter [Phaeovulum veldkampii]TDQ56435.1 drug/metabolite transporter (DMT)-like permease [Phaeovulum veldkampii DSM 11550]
MIDNLRGSLLMTAAMAGFAIEDMFVKGVTRTVPVGEVLALMGIFGALIFALGARLRGERIVTRDLILPTVIARNLGELVGTIGFVLAIALTPLAQASAILQALPLAVTLGAALYLGEHVGWRRWTAIGVGFVGVLIVIRPGMNGFDPLSVFALIGVAGLAARDVVTRRVPRTLSGWQLSTSAFATLVPAGLLMMPAMGHAPVLPTLAEAGAIAAALGFGMAAYLALVAATRTGDVASVTPFRYTRLLFALVIGWAVFDEMPDAATILGGAVIVASGLYTLWREARLRQRGI